MSLQKYLDLITSEHQDKPDFVATVSQSLAPMIQIQALLTSMIALFDLDTPPAGDQLDIIGRWVGISRKLHIPITGIFFTWDGPSANGWDFGVWQDPNNPGSVVILPDANYLILLRAKIAANHWDGTTESAYAVWNIILPGVNLLIQDGQNMSFIVAIQGTLIDSLTLALLTGGYLPLKPEGIRISEYIIPVDTGPLFGWDLGTAFIDGWESGSWGMEIPPT
jgi:hypothetical protein